MSKLLKAKVPLNSQNFVKITNWYGYNVILTRKTSDKNNTIILFGDTTLSGVCAKGVDICAINGQFAVFSIFLSYFCLTYVLIVSWQTSFDVVNPFLCVVILFWVVLFLDPNASEGCIADRRFLNLAIRKSKKQKEMFAETL